MGVANERSIAWGISQKLSEAGAELAFTYLGDALKKRVVPLAEKLNSNVTFSCDVEKKEDVIKLFFIIIKQYIASCTDAAPRGWPDKDLVELIFGISFPKASLTAFNSVISPTGVEVPCVFM